MINSDYNLRIVMNPLKLRISLMLVLFWCCFDAVGQRIQQVPDSIRKKYEVQQQEKRAREKGPVIDYASLNQDSLIKIKLVNLAMNNPNVLIADANIRIAEANQKQARLAWLNSVVVGANINEFVVQNSAAASFFPKYNIGASVPLDIFSRTKREKKVAHENIIISHESKKDRQTLLKSEVLMRYENYKEKREVVILQKSYMEYDYSAYEAAQRAYSDGDMTIDDMNKTHQIYLTEKSKLVTRERDLNIAIIQLEELIGVPLSEAFQIP